MLQFYYHPLSPLARRVWIGLLEKNIPFELIQISLKDGEQFKPEFLAINPFHHVPVIVDNVFRVLESLAILDYLEIKYPQPPLLPRDPQQLAKVRMVQMVTTNELASNVIPLIMEREDSLKLKQAQRKITRILNFFSELLGDEAYFSGDRLGMGDIVAGNAVLLLAKLDFELNKTPKIYDWCARLMQREVWQKTQPNAEQIEIFKQTVQTLIVSQQVKLSKLDTSNS